MVALSQLTHKRGRTAYSIGTATQPSDSVCAVRGRTQRAGQEDIVHHLLKTRCCGFELVNKPGSGINTSFVHICLSLYLWISQIRYRPGLLYLSTGTRPFLTSPTWSLLLNTHEASTGSSFLRAGLDLWLERTAEG